MEPVSGNIVAWYLGSYSLERTNVDGKTSLKEFNDTCTIM